MSNIWTQGSKRRDFLKMTAAAGVAGSGLSSLPGMAQAAPLNFYTWSAAVDTVKSHPECFRDQNRHQGQLQQCTLGAISRHHGDKVCWQGAA